MNRNGNGTHLGYPPPGATPPMAEREKPDKYKEYRDYVKLNSSSDIQRNGSFGSNSQEMRMGNEEGFPGDEAPPPSLPPRNYNSQYRSEFHQQQHQQSSHQNQHGWRQSQSDNSHTHSHTQLSQDMDGSLLDLADELGDGRASSTSLHSSSAGRRSQNEASGYPRDGKYSVRLLLILAMYVFQFS